MKLSKKRYTSLEDLLANPPDYDRYLCGSDQVWNPTIFRPNGFDPAFFMPFAGEKKRAAYAPSFGMDSIPEPYIESLREYLSGFAPFGKGVIGLGSRKLTGRVTEVAPDPTMLLDESDWLRICPRKRKMPYLPCYFIQIPRPSQAWPV